MMIRALRSRLVLQSSLQPKMPRHPLRHQGRHEGLTMNSVRESHSRENSLSTLQCTTTFTRDLTSAGLTSAGHFGHSVSQVMTAPYWLTGRKGAASIS